MAEAPSTSTTSDPSSSGCDTCHLMYFRYKGKAKQDALLRKQKETKKSKSLRVSTAIKVHGMSFESELRAALRRLRRTPFDDVPCDICFLWKKKNEMEVALSTARRNLDAEGVKLFKRLLAALKYKHKKGVYRFVGIEFTADSGAESSGADSDGY